MILYFTGTNNSKYVAKNIGAIINEEAINLFDKIRNEDYTDFKSYTPYIIVSPTYSWQIPHILRDYLKKINLCGNKNIYFVMTCGGEIGNSEKYLKSLSQDINMNFMGCCGIVMPENYIALFDVPSETQSEKIIKNADEKIKSVAMLIKNNRVLEKNTATPKDRFLSSVVNDIFYPFFVKDKKFYATDKCTSCGLCAKKCPLNNISIVNDKPQWNGNCTHCMACISFCKTKAIEYGKSSINKRRYICKEI